MSDPEDSTGGRLRDWSRRKRDATRQDQAVEEPIVDPVPEVPEPPVDDPEVIAALPSLDDITADFDMTPFLAKGVPAHLKNAALRKLWAASPAVRDYLDPAVDYAWDWNAPGGVPGGGGVLSEHSIAKMVKDIIGAPAQDTDEVMSDEIPLTDADPTDASHHIDDPEPVAVRRVAQPENEPSEDKDARPVADYAAMLPLRRHGGATPE